MICQEHPTYKAIRKPKSTKVNTEGCSECWKVYNEKNGIEAQPEKAAPKEKKVKPSKITKKQSAAGGQSSTAVQAKADVISERKAKSVDDASVPILPVVTRESLLVELSKEIDGLVSEILERRLAAAKQLLSRELEIEYEHLFVHDDEWQSGILAKLEAEHWQWMHHTYPLAKQGLIKKDYHLLKRVKRSTNKPIPNFGDEKIRKGYLKK